MTGMTENPHKNTLNLPFDVVAQNEQTEPPRITIQIIGEIEEVESVDIYFKDRKENKKR